MLAFSLQIGHLSFLSLKGVHGLGSLQFVSDDVLAHFILQLSLNGQQLDVYDVLDVMSLENRKLNESMMIRTNDGRTFATAWISIQNIVSNNLKSNDEEIGKTDVDKPKQEWLVLDGVTLDAETLCAVDNRDRPLSPTKMTVKELRAELTARQYSLRGNKRELIKQVQKARDEAQNDRTVESQKGGKAKVRRIVEEQIYIDGRLIDNHILKNEGNDDQDDAEDEDNNDDAEETEDNMTLDTDDEEDEVDYDSRIDTIMQARRKIKPLPPLQETDSWIEQSLALCAAIFTLHGALSTGDVDTLVASIEGSSNRALHAAQLISVLQREDAEGKVPCLDKYIENLGKFTRQ